MIEKRRLIDANGCIRYIMSQMGHSQANVEQIAEYIAEYFDQNAIDAVEVVHGRWICLEAEIGYFACSECDHRILRAKCNYCPNCGANMDGGNEDVE